MKLYIKFVLAASMMLANLAAATEALQAGTIKNLSYRGGYVTFNVIGDGGVNYCESCPTDPGSRGNKACWIEEGKQVQISILLSAQARGKKIYGRVPEFVSNCSIYQMTVEN